MQQLRGVVLGATGLVGGQLVKALLDNPAFVKVRILVRRQVQISHPKLEVCMVDFSNKTQLCEAIGAGDVIFCCVGTTMKSVGGDRQLYRSIDFDIAVHAAICAQSAGYSRYLLVSSIGANPQAANFYTRLKGEVEQAVIGSGIPAVDIFRPSLLLRNRDEVRMAEKVGAVLMKGMKLLLQGKWRKYRAIAAVDLARAMANVAIGNGSTGVSYYYYDEIMQLR